MKPAFLIGALAFAQLCGIRVWAIPDGPPATSVFPVTDIYHSVAVTDPYRWLENGQGPVVRAWTDAQNRFSRATLDALPDMERIRTRITEMYSRSSPAYSRVVFAAGRCFAIRRDPAKQQPCLVVMASIDRCQEARVLVDPNLINPRGTTAIDWFVPSPDGRRVAVSISEGGSEAGDVHFFDTETGVEGPETLPHVQNGTGGGALAWTQDGKSVFYTRYPRGDERPKAEHGFFQQLYRHDFGQPTSSDHHEIGSGFSPIAEIDIRVSREGLVLATVEEGDGGQMDFYLRLLDGHWIQLAQHRDEIKKGVFGPSEDGRTVPIYLLSRHGASRGKIVRLTVDPQTGSGAEITLAQTIVPEGLDSMATRFREPGNNVVVTATRIYVVYQLGGPSEVRAFTRAGERVPGPESVPLTGTEAMVHLDASGDRVLFARTSYLVPPAWILFDPATNETRVTALSETSAADFSDCEVVREFATAPDGTRIPVNLIRPRGLRVGVTHPCVLTGYGGYTISIAPSFRPALRVLFDQGVIFAEANLRGGGEFGEEWHRQGNLERKQNVFDDFAAVCRYLVEQGHTSSAKLAIQGRSNGGLLMGAILTQHPELVRCVVSGVGIYDMLRVEQSPNGRFNTTEFGSVRDEAQFRALYSYSPYHHFSANQTYPPMLLLTGANDPRVDPMQSRKMTARLQAIGGFALLRTSANAGHGHGSNLSSTIETAVDTYAFILSQLGVEYNRGPR